MVRCSIYIYIYVILEVTVKVTLRGQVFGTESFLTVCNVLYYSLVSCLWGSRSQGLNCQLILNPHMQLLKTLAFYMQLCMKECILIQGFKQSLTQFLSLWCHGVTSIVKTLSTMTAARQGWVTSKI